MNLIIIELTNDVVFDYFFSIFFNMSIYLVPLFGAFALTKN